MASEFLGVESFKTVDELKSLRESKGNRSPELLKASEANKLYYKACPTDDLNLDRMLAYLDEYAEQKESKNRSWVVSNAEKYSECIGGKLKWDDEVEPEVRGKNARRSSKMRTMMDNCDLGAFYRQIDDGGNQNIFVEDVIMENLMRARADDAKEKLRIRKYKKHMKQFLKVYKIMKGSELDYSDALKTINAPSVREAYSCDRNVLDGQQSYWSLGRYSFPIKMETFHVNRRRLSQILSSKYTRAVALLKGGQDLYQYDSNEKYPFRQEPFFTWTFGATEPNLWGLLDCWSGKAVLIRDEASEYDEVSSSELQAKYEVDQVTSIDQMESVIRDFNPQVLLILSGENVDSGRPFPTISIEFSSDAEVDDTSLYKIMVELRVLKTNFELDLMRYASKISSLAHRLVMRRITAECYEYQAEALFRFFVHFVGGCSSLSSTPICASGPHTANAEYKGQNSNRLIKCDDLIIFDMGASFHGYASSIACTTPAGGVFNLEQKLIYKAVLATRNAALDVMKAGVHWYEVHQNAMRALLTGLCETGIISGEVEGMLNDGIASLFMPIGIGHFIGLGRLDVGGKTEIHDGSSIVEPSDLGSLKINRVLKPGMVVVVQAGCYFNYKDIVAAATDPEKKKYFDREKLCKYLSLGGIYIKDTVEITHQGYELLSDLPRTIEEVEDWVGGKYADDFNAEFESESKLKKDELWLGVRRNPCSSYLVNNRI